MHIAYLSLFPDIICSCLLDWSNTARCIPGATREARLNALWQSYKAWCDGSNVADRAQARLFTVAILRPNGAKYPEVSQKVLSATASRYFIHWLCSMARLVVQGLGSMCEVHDGQHASMNVRCVSLHKIKVNPSASCGFRGSELR